MDLISQIVERAKANKQRIVLPEGTEERTLKAANQILTDEVADLIAACKADLRKHGVVKISESDPLIKQAVKLYCKGNFGYGGDDAERFQKSYESLANSLSLCGDYLED